MNTNLHALLYPITFRRQFVINQFTNSRNPFSFGHENPSSVKFEPYFLFVFNAQRFSNATVNDSEVKGLFHKIRGQNDSDQYYLMQYIKGRNGNIFDYVSELRHGVFTPLQYAAKLAHNLVHRMDVTGFIQDNKLLCDIYVVRVSDCDQYVHNNRLDPNVAAFRRCLTGQNGAYDTIPVSLAGQVTFTSQLSLPFSIGIPSRNFNVLVAQKIDYHEVLKPYLHPSTEITTVREIKQRLQSNSYLNKVMKRSNSSFGEGVYLNRDAIMDAVLDVDEQVIVQDVNPSSEIEFRFHVVKGVIVYGVHTTGSVHTIICNEKGASAADSTQSLINALYNSNKGSLIYLVYIIWWQFKANCPVRPDRYMRIDIAQWPDGNWYLNELESFACGKVREAQSDVRPLKIVDTLLGTDRSNFPSGTPFQTGETINKFLNAAVDVDAMLQMMLGR